MNKDKIQDKYLEIVEKLHIEEFEGYDLKQILFNETWYAQNMTKKKVWIHLVAVLFCSKAEFAVKNEGNQLLFFSQVWGRADHDGYWNAIKNLFESYDEVQIHFLRKKEILRRFSLKGIGTKLSKYSKFKNALKEIENPVHRRHLAQVLLELYLFGGKLEQWNLNPQVCMCFFDSGFYENYAMQYFKKKGTTTITNQHSQPIFRDWHEDKLNQSQILNFKCDYYIAKGEFTKKQFVNAGLDGERVKVLGSLTKRVKEEKDYAQKKVFGLFFDAPSYEFARRINLEMIKIAEQVCTALGYKYYIKLHPADNRSLYEAAVTENCIEMYGKEKKLNEVFQNIDFGIFHASGVYLDMLAAGVKGYKYETDVKFPIVLEAQDLFSDVEELKQKYETWLEKDDNDKASYIDNVYATYVVEEDVENKISEFVKVCMKNGENCKL